MVVYFVYIHNLPDKVYKNMDGNVYLPDLKYNKENETWAGFYGFTKDKKILKEFIEIHNKKYFTSKKKKITKDEYYNFKKNHIGYFITLNKYKAGKKKVYKLATTNDEHIHASENCEDIILNKLEGAYLKVAYFPHFDYRIFEEKYRDLLEKIYYGTLFDILSSDESKQDLADYNRSFGMTSDGNYKLYYEYNTFNVFITIYNSILQT